MRRVLLGTAHLYAVLGPGASGALLDRAWQDGVRSFDTAPSYGRGLSEPSLGTFLAGRDGVDVVATKVGLEAAGPPPRGKAAVVAAVDRVLPASAADRLRRAVRGSSVAEGPGRSALFGHFGATEVRQSVERSLRRLGGRVDRLLLHEVLPGDVTDELVEVLERLVASGDVGEVGSATATRHTAAVLAATGPVLTAAQFAAGPLAEVPELPDHVTTRVGHGLLGPAGADLRALAGVLEGDGAASERWRTACAGTVFAEAGGLAAALLARDPRTGPPLTDVVVATSRPDRLAATVSQAAGAEPVPTAVAEALTELVDAVREPLPLRR